MYLRQGADPQLRGRTNDRRSESLSIIQRPHIERYHKAERPLQMLTKVPAGGPLHVKKEIFSS